MKLKKSSKFLLQAAGNHLLYYAADVLCKSLRVKVKNFENSKSLLTNKNAVIAFWHGTMLMPWYFFRNFRMSALVSSSNDGELLSRVLGKWDYEVERGSSNKGGKEALEKLVHLASEKYSVAITPDGPKGPPFKMKPGAVVAAKKSGIPLIMVGVSFNKKRNLNSWDKFEIPKLFSKVNFVFADPIIIDENLSREDTSTMIEKCNEKLISLQQEASVFD